ncbi:MAG: DNA alkylation repair protein [Enterococcus sp.]
MTRLIFEKNAEEAVGMARYMKNHFDFAGVKKPVRAQLQKPYIKDSKQWAIPKLLSEITYYYQQPEREYQYFAIELTQNNVKRLSFENLKELLPLVQQKEWWDSIDSWRKVYGTWIGLHPEYLERIFGLFEQQEDFWLRRIAITLQLQSKEKTNCDLLKKALYYDMNTEEFFIQKAIGWSLRAYAKTDPEWVRQLLRQENFSKLATREASKYL